MGVEAYNNELQHGSDYEGAGGADEMYPMPDGAGATGSTGGPGTGKPMGGGRRRRRTKRGKSGKRNGNMRRVKTNRKTNRKQSRRRRH